ncbi:hypothetical protein [Absidia glauca]|uniref:Uncharacterized protein n=1 Tax=Absidia glauca TaxID=4829 RepID=A0A163JHT7_ABSGL|nr:hypothetical protein [Absidia glauca]
MKRTCPSNPSLLRLAKDSTKKPTSKLTRHRKPTKLMIKKTDYCQPPYRTKKHRHLNRCPPTIELPQQRNGKKVDVDLTCLTALRQEAYDELHRQMQQYNDSFVIRMQQVEQQQQQRKSASTEGQRPNLQRRRSSTTTQQHHLHHYPRRTSFTTSPLSPPRHLLYQQHQQQQEEEEEEPSIESLVDLLETGTIKDYSLLTEWELCQNPQLALDEEQGGFGDLW